VGDKRRKFAGIVCQIGYRLASVVTYGCGAAKLSDTASTQNSGDCRLTLNFWERVIKGRQENISHAIHSEVSRKLGSVNVCAVVELEVPRLK
jgi:hypothetical protein